MANDYNGWHGNGNRESAWATWNMALWVDNDEYTYKARRRAGLTDADDVEKFCRSVFPEGTPDMSGHEMDDVSWEEIWDHWKDED